MMWRSNTSTGFTLRAALLAFVVAGCAANPAPEPAATAGIESGAVTVTVRNNHREGRDMVVYLEPSGRDERQTLGTVAAGSTGSFSVESARGYYTLIAAHNLGEVTSSRFNIPGPSTVTWTMEPSRVVVSPR